MKQYSVVICGGGSTYTLDMIELVQGIRAYSPDAWIILSMPTDCVRLSQAR